MVAFGSIIFCLFFLNCTKFWIPDHCAPPPHNIIFQWHGTVNPSCFCAHPKRSTLNMLVQWGSELQTHLNKELLFVRQWLTIQMPGTMVPGMWRADQYSNGGLKTGPLTKWGSEYETTMVLGIWIANFCHLFWDINIIPDRSSWTLSSNITEKNLGTLRVLFKQPFCYINCSLRGELCEVSECC